MTGKKKTLADRAEALTVAFNELAAAGRAHTNAMSICQDTTAKRLARAAAVYAELLRGGKAPR